MQLNFVQTAKASAQKSDVLDFSQFHGRKCPVGLRCMVFAGQSVEPYHSIQELENISSKKYRTVGQMREGTHSAAKPHLWSLLKV